MQDQQNLHVTYNLGSYSVETDINARAYYNASSLVAKPGKAVATAVILPILAVAHSALTYAVGHGLSACFGLEDTISEAVITTGVGITSLYATGMLSAEIWNSGVAHDLHDTYKVTSQLAVAAIGQVYETYTGNAENI